MRFSIIISALLIGIYPIVHFISEEPFGLLAMKSPTILQNEFWHFSFYLHIIFSGISLLVGWTQFTKKRSPILHRNIGYLYVVSVIIGAISGIYIAFWATGGLVSSIGFISLGITWLSITLIGFYKIIIGHIHTHKRYMVYSYALCFAAVTLRIWLPILVLIFNDFTIAYKIVAWLCWIPNIILTFYINKEVTVNQV